MKTTLILWKKRLEKAWQRGEAKNHRGLYLGKALRLVWQSAPGWTVVSALLLVVQGVLPLVSLYLMKLGDR